MRLSLLLPFLVHFIPISIGKKYFLHKGFFKSYPFKKYPHFNKILTARNSLFFKNVKSYGKPKFGLFSGFFTFSGLWQFYRSGCNQATEGGDAVTDLLKLSNLFFMIKNTLFFD
ncbi:MAG: hypothetical protein LBU85_11810 [Treponema sp.]|jgi:hypothetical protein|nr:hypothetical protein [Treponema sp.]